MITQPVTSDTKVCPFCDQTFTRKPSMSRRKFATITTCGTPMCRGARKRSLAWADIPQTKICEICGQPFTRQLSVDRKKWLVRTTCGGHCGHVLANRTRAATHVQLCIVCRQPRGEGRRLTCGDPKCVTQRLHDVKYRRLLTAERNPALMPTKPRLVEPLSARALLSLEQECTSEFRARVLAEAEAAG